MPMVARFPILSDYFAGHGEHVQQVMLRPVLSFLVLLVYFREYLDGTARYCNDTDVITCPDKPPVIPIKDRLPSGAAPRFVKALESGKELPVLLGSLNPLVFGYLEILHYSSGVSTVLA